MGGGGWGVEAGGAGEEERIGEDEYEAEEGVGEMEKEETGDEEERIV